MSFSEDNRKKVGQDDGPNDVTETRNVSDAGGNLEPHHPREIGQYLIKRVIASGGMGTVFEAAQKSPRRPVAVKVVKGSDISDKAVGRLKYEAQMLARLRHPGIAEIYEAGTYEDNGVTVPYFAMEYIPNARTITDYAAAKRLSINERLRLFIQACDAVNYGHQKGIVHRDLKPDNILVDSNGRVRVIDFGLAHATDSDLRQTNVQTQVGQIVGSLQYMSPEQFDADSRDLDTRSDVYSLGVVLYELLSGSLPYVLSARNVYEVAGIIREKPPSTLRKSGFKVAAEIDIILQKCLMKERELRYQTAFGLRQDLCRYLAGDAIVARSPSLTYQLKVFARKNKGLVTTVASAFVLLAAGVIITSSLLVQVSQERERAVMESEKARKANDFLASIFEEAVPDGFGEPVPISKLLDNSVKMLDGAFPDDPEIEADIRHSLGLSYFYCENYREARHNLRRSYELRKDALGLEHPDTRQTLVDLNFANSVEGRDQDYLAVCKEMCTIDSLKYGPVSDNALSTRLRVAYGLGGVGEIPTALEVVREVRAAYAKEDSGDVKLANDIDQYLAWFLLQNGQLEEAERVARDNYELAVAHIEDDAYIRESRSVLAATLIANGKLDESVQLYGSFPTLPELDVEYSFQGELDPDKAGLLMIVFWEEWCPFCDRMMFQVENLYRQYRNAGISVIGLTTLSQGSERDEAEEFLRAHDVTFPVIKEGGRAADYFNVRSIPDVRLIYKGRLIWEKRVPCRDPISRYMLDGLVKAQKINQL